MLHLNCGVSERFMCRIKSALGPNLFELLDVFGLHQHVREPMRVSGHTIDLATLLPTAGLT